jgi:phage baseplate assembly protein W
MIIEIANYDQSIDDGYRITVAEEIRRVLQTKRGAIPMNPDYGSDLHQWVDRSLDGVTRLGLIRDSFDAIERNITRIIPTRVEIIMLSDGAFGLKVHIQRSTHVTAA